MKVAITADIHVDDYHRCNPSKFWRLNQFPKLAERINEICHEQGCEELWIAGDFLNKAVNDPKPNNVAARMAKLWTKSLKVRYIRGQHDIQGKVTMEDPDNSNLNMLDYMEYMDHKILERSGHKFAFMDYSKHQDLSWIDHVDVMIGHISIGYGQDWDRTKFNLGFFGDIHKEFINGNCVSIGNPIQKDMNSQETGSIIVLDTRTLDWKRVAIDPDHTRFLRMVYTEEGLGYDGKLTWELKKSKKIKVKSAKEVIKLEDLSFNEILEDKIKENRLEEVHKKVLFMSSDYHPINFNFSVKSIHIHNIKGIHDFQTSIDSNLMIIGRNGSGKSSFIIALYQFLTGEMDWDRIQRRNASDGYVEGEILYEGKSYYLKRSKNSNHLKIDGKEVTYKDKNDFPKVVSKELPFTRYNKAYYFNYWVRELLRTENTGLLIQIVSKFNGLDIFDNFNRSIDQLIDSENSNLKDLQTSINTYKAMRESKVRKRDGIRIPEYFNPEYVELYQLRYEAFKTLASTESLRIKLARLKKLAEGLNEDILRSKINQLRTRKRGLEEFITQFEKLKTSGKESAIKIENLKSEVTKLQTSNLCPKCGNEMDEDHRKDELIKIQSEIKLINESYLPMLDQFRKMKASIATYREELDNLPNQIEMVNDQLSNLRSYNEIKDEVIEASKVDERILIGFIGNYDVGEASESLNDWRKMNSDFNTLNSLTEEINELDEKLLVTRTQRDKSKALIGSYQVYKNLVSKDGVIFESILTNLTSKLSNDNFKFKVKSEEIRKVKYLRITVRYFDAEVGEWRDYEDCSQGQKSLCDSYFLYKLMNGCGLVVFDEYYSHVDDDNLPMISEFLNSMDVGSVIVSTHSYNFPLDAKVMDMNQVKGT